MTLGKKLHAGFGGWFGIIMCAIFWPIVLSMAIGGRITWYGAIVAGGFVWVFSWGQYQERMRKNQERQNQLDLCQENAKLREENEKLRRKVIQCCEHSSLH